LIPLLSLSPTTDGINTGSSSTRVTCSTRSAVAGPTYTLNVDRAFDAGASYAGLPVIVDVAARDRALDLHRLGRGGAGYTWREQSVVASLRLPLTVLDGQTRQSLVSSVTLGRTHIKRATGRLRFENNATSRR
jgi:hypothetical protein